MSNVVVVNNLALDGVPQGPGRPNASTRGRFEHGGWARVSSEDPAIGRAMAGGWTRGRPQGAAGRGFRGPGSGELVQSLMRRALIDEFVPLIHPLVLGSEGRRFSERWSGRGAAARRRGHDGRRRRRRVPRAEAVRVSAGYRRRRAR